MYFFFFVSLFLRFFTFIWRVAVLLGSYFFLFTDILSIIPPLFLFSFPLFFTYDPLSSLFSSLFVTAFRSYSLPTVPLDNFLFFPFALGVGCFYPTGFVFPPAFSQLTFSPLPPTARTRY